VKAKQWVSTFTLDLPLTPAQRLALLLGRRLFVDVATVSLRDPVSMTVNAVVKTAPCKVKTHD